jgi:aminoglycoside phosphotransferase (APT) family kinase protein
VTTEADDLSELAEFLDGIGLSGKEAVTIEPLSGGVSNDVYLASFGTTAVVVKRALAKLRVDADWQADIRRLDTERRALELAHSILPGAVPAVIGYDGRFLAIEKAPDGWCDWKLQLMEQHVDPRVAAALGRMLATLQRATQGISGFTDTTAFRQLRTDPFHGEVARRFPALAPALRALIDELSARSVCLVHGDFSPKNVLVGTNGASGGPWVIDWEVAHRGDPDFDPAFLLCHLLLKSLLHPATSGEYEDCAVAFLAEYNDVGGLAEDPRSILRHVGALVLARVHGKSPVSYLDEAARTRAVDIGRDCLLDPPDSVTELWSALP